MGSRQPRRARQYPQRRRRPDAGQSRGARRRRDMGQWQADPRDDPRRRAAGHRPLPLFRGLRARAGGLDLRDRPRHRGLSFPRAARRRRPDHSVELPAADGRVETRARARRRQLRGDEAGRTNARVDSRLGRDRRRSLSERRAQHRQRLWPRGRQAAGVVEPHRQDRLHRRDDDGPAHHAIRQPEPHPGDARTRRQVAQHFLRGRRARGRRLSSTRRSKAS